MRFTVVSKNKYDGVDYFSSIIPTKKCVRIPGILDTYIIADYNFEAIVVKKRGFLGTLISSFTPSYVIAINDFLHPFSDDMFKKFIEEVLVNQNFSSPETELDNNILERYEVMQSLARPLKAFPFFKKITVIHFYRVKKQEKFFRT